MVRHFLLMLLFVSVARAASPDATVAADGSGDYTTVRAALDAAPQITHDDGHRWVILVKPGNYRELVSVQREKRFVTLVGADADETTIFYDLFANVPGPDGKPIGTFRTPTLSIDADDFTLENLTISNTAGPKGQALALRLDGDRITVRHCKLTGWQDTLLVNRGRHYFQDCTIEGATDFIFGGATDWFESCHIVATGSGFLTAASTPDFQPFGYVFDHCDIKAAANVKTYLGRPWRDYAQVVYLHTSMCDAIRPEGWDNWKKTNAEKTVNYAEFDSTGPGAPAGQRVAWSKQLTAAEAEKYTIKNVLGGADGWNPTAKAEIPPAATQHAGASAASTQPITADQEHARIIRFLEDRVHKDPDDITAQNRLAAEYLRRFRQTGDDNDLILSNNAARQSLRSVPAVQNSTALAASARATFALHGFSAARDMALQLVDQQPDKRYTFEILGDALLELGDYDAAADAYKKMEAFDDPDAGSESRMARLAMIHGDNEQARKRFDSATNLARQVLPPAPDVVAWCLVQSGQLAFNTGDFDTAEKQYQSALEANPNDWSAIDHLAELRAAQKRYDESLALYLPLVARVHRPELLQNLGDVYAIMGNTGQATQWHQRSLEKYLASVALGSSYYHHLSGFYSDTEPNPTEAVKWAKKDMEVRHSVYAYDSLAWALYKNGDDKPAAEAMDKALALGTKDSHLLYHASLIYYRAGQGTRARDCLLLAGTVNPHFSDFHVHR